MNYDSDHTRTEHRECIAEMAKSAFKDHVITETVNVDAVKIFDVRKPGTSIYGYRLIFVPWNIIMLGDVGTQVFCVTQQDSLDFLGLAHDSPDYLMEKACHAEKVFLVAEALQYIEEIEESDKLREAFQEHPWYDDDPPQAWREAYQEVCQDSAPWFDDYNARAWWHYQALKRFWELHSAQLV